MTISFDIDINGKPPKEDLSINFLGMDMTIRPKRINGIPAFEVIFMKDSESDLKIIKKDKLYMQRYLVFREHHGGFDRT